jgi:CRP-like cAMP-binding protein
MSAAQTRPPRASNPQPEHQPLVAALEEIGASLKVRSGALLFAEGEPPSGVFVVLSGVIRLLLHGKRFYRDAGPGSIVGLPAAVSDQPYSLSGKALEDCEVVQVEQKAMMTLLASRTDLSWHVVSILAEEVRRMRQHAGELAGGFQ